MWDLLDVFLKKRVVKRREFVFWLVGHTCKRRMWSWASNFKVENSHKQKHYVEKFNFKV